jgi:hypothetical protein
VQNELHCKGVLDYLRLVSGASRAHTSLSWFHIEFHIILWF